MDTTFRTIGFCATALLAVLPLALGCEAAETNDANAITIGLLLPFTGDDSATSSNFEKAALFARDEVNRGGGVKGRPLRIVSADTHSDVVSARRSLDSLIGAGAIVIIGPESAEIAATLKPVLDERQITFLSPLVGAADDRAVDCATPWFRLAPSARAQGEAIAKQAIAEALDKAAILHSDSAYDWALRQAFENRFTALGGEIAFADTLPGDAQSYAGTIAGALTANVDAILLSTSPRTGALLVNEFGVLSPATPRWFLSPLLKTDLLLQNVAPQTLEGAKGVTAKIFDTSGEFPQAFAHRWSGDQPLEGAFFYYDAVALLAFALERTILVDGQILASAVQTAAFEAAGPPGEAAGWREIPVFLERTRQQADIYYSGLTGPLLFQPCGERRVGAASNWQIQAGRIITEP
jgi:ABC-type branched-subunit amino acid transport system substrate-binding protein